MNNCEVSVMKLVNVTNSHSKLVLEQLENTDAYLVKVYTVNDTLVLYTEAPLHNEILIVNNQRTLRDAEVEDIKMQLLKKTPADLYTADEISTITEDHFIEISIPKKSLI